MVNFESILNHPTKCLDDDGLEYSAKLLRGLAHYLGIDYPQWKASMQKYYAKTKLKASEVSRMKSSLNSSLASKRVTWDRIETFLNIVCGKGYSIELIPNWNMNFDYGKTLPTVIKLPKNKHNQCLRLIFLDLFRKLGLVPGTWDYLVSSSLETIFKKAKTEDAKHRRYKDWAKNNLMNAINNKESLLLDRFITAMYVLGMGEFTFRFKFPESTCLEYVCDFKPEQSDGECEINFPTKTMFIARNITELQE